MKKKFKFALFISDLIISNHMFQASMKDVAVNTVVVTEIACWFFIGECIGKGSLVGYNV